MANLGPHRREGGARQGGIVFQAVLSALLVIFLVLAGRNQRAVIPSRDYQNYIMETVRVFPPT